MIFCIPVFSVWFVVITGIPRKISGFLYKNRIWIKYGTTPDADGEPVNCTMPARIKPLDCESCLAFWLTFIYVFSFNSIDDSILLSGATAFFTIPLKKLL